ncbi:MAG TPA: hypothetical protein PKG52_07025 [bacterium]|nr:hypothetical protein [bacterium]HPS28944.1 hypothetical protein [bacterium]
MRNLLTVLLFFVSFSLIAENMWINQRASEFVTASGGFIDVGTKTKGYAMGTADDGQGGKSPYCFVMTDGLTWNDCSANLTGKMKFVAPARVLPNGKLVGVILELQGFKTLSSFIVSDDLANFIPAYFFDSSNADDQPSGYGEALSVVGDNVWLGLKNGKIKKSTDLGKTWENIVVSTDTAMEMTVVKFKDELNGIAAGGVLTEGTDTDGATVSDVQPKGSIFRTSDGGTTWTPIVQNLEAFPEDVIETSNGRLFMQYYDDTSINDSSTGQKSLVWSDDSFATFAGYNESFDITVPSGTFSMGGVMDMDEGAVDEIWIAGFCGSGFNFKPCTIDTTDGGATWWERLVQGAGKLGPISVLDSNHVYIAGMSKAMWKWGDPNEDLTETEIPDDTETPDNNIETDDNPVVDNNPADDTAVDDIDNEVDDAVIDEEAVGCGCSLVS